MIAALAICLVMAALLSGLESAALSVSKVRLRHQAKVGDPAARRLEALLAKPDRFFPALLLAANAFALASYALITRECVRHVDGWRGYALAFGIGVGVYLLWVEMVPKSLFRQFPYRLLTFFLPLLRLVDGGLAPVLGIARLFSSPGQSVDRENGDARAEFLRLAETIEKDGALGRVEARLIRNAVALRELPARDLMVPAGRVTAVQPGMAADAIFDLSRSTGLDQFPVMDPQGNYAGLVLVIDVLRRVPGTGATAADFQKRILRAKPDDSALSVLLRLRRIGIPLAAIYPDGKGGRPLGIVGASDILKRLTEADREPAESR